MVNTVEVIDDTANILELVTAGPTGPEFSLDNLIFVETADDLPTAVSGVRTLDDGVTYFLTTDVDLAGDRLVGGENSVILGASSENCKLSSTGLVSALITSNYSLPIRNISIEAALALDLDGDGVATALDWDGVNFVNCAEIGTVQNYSNFLLNNSAFLNSSGLTIDGNIGTFGINGCLIDTASGGTGITIAATANITRRFRIIYSSFVTASGETGIYVDESATIPVESYILDVVNFSGGGTYIDGVPATDNKALFRHCKGVENTATVGQLYMQDNAVATTVSAINTFYKVAGTSLEGPNNQRFTITDGRLTCNAAIDRKYHILANLSFNSGNNNICEFGFYSSVSGAVITSSRIKSTANTAGRAENISLLCMGEIGENEYVEIHCANKTGTNNITVTDLNFLIIET